MHRLIYALIFAAGLWLMPAAAHARPWGSPEELDPIAEEREAEKRAERNALLLVGMLAAIIGGSALYQWGQEIREILLSFAPRRGNRVLIPVKLDDEYDDDD